MTHVQLGIIFSPSLRVRRGLVASLLEGSRGCGLPRDGVAEGFLVLDIRISSKIAVFEPRW